MTLARYGHLRFKQVPLAGVIVASWLIAFVEYCTAGTVRRIFVVQIDASQDCGGADLYLSNFSSCGHDGAMWLP